jgi:hypothetical protein
MMPTNPQAFLAGRTRRCPVSFIRSKLTAGFIAFCIIFNCLAPRFSLSAHSDDLIRQVLASQSVLLQFFSLSTLPLRIVNSLFGGEAGLPCPLGQNLPGKDDDSAANSSADFSVFHFSKKLSGQSGFGQYLDRGAPALLAICLRQYPVFREPAYAGGAPICGCLIMLFLMFLLPRSGIDDNAGNAMRVSPRYPTVRTVGFFICPERTDRERLI